MKIGSKHIPLGKVTLWWLIIYDSPKRESDLVMTHHLWLILWLILLQVWSCFPQKGKWPCDDSSSMTHTSASPPWTCKQYVGPLWICKQSLGTCLHCFQNLPSSTGNKVYSTKANSYINWKRDLFVILLSQFVDALFNMVILHDTILQILGADTLLDFCPQICGLNVLQVSF